MSKVSKTKYAGLFLPTYNFSNDVSLNTCPNILLEKTQKEIK